MPSTKVHGPVARRNSGGHFFSGNGALVEPILIKGMCLMPKVINYKTSYLLAKRLIGTSTVDSIITVNNSKHPFSHTGLSGCLVSLRRISVLVALIVFQLFGVLLSRIWTTLISNGFCTLFNITGKI